MYAYKTNSADYLDYVASVKSRKEIMADPDLCLLLENELIRDNMEMAIRWNAAKYGDYQDKYDFMEYFMCNGPQLDADTILHYRMKAYNDPVCMEIAYSYLSDTNHLSEIRKEKYDKETDNCFKNPCFYMGKFSAMMGSCGDDANASTAFNMVSRWVNSCKETLERNRQQQEVNRGERKEVDKTTTEDKNKDKDKDKNTAATGSDTTVDAGGTPPSKNSETPPPPPPPGSMRHAFQGGVISGMWQGCKNMWAQITTGNEEFTTELVECTNAASNAKKVGDKLSKPVSEMLDLVTKANVRRQLGDCARLWSHVRRLHLFSNENKYGPIVSSQIVSNTNTNGTPKKVVGDPQPTAAKASSTVAAAKRAKTTARRQARRNRTQFEKDLDAGMSAAVQMVDDSINAFNNALLEDATENLSDAINDLTNQISAQITSGGHTIQMREEATRVNNSVNNVYPSGDTVGQRIESTSAATKNDWNNLGGVGNVSS